jgi:hypothetical protein
MLKPATKQIARRRNHFGLLAQNSGNGTWLSSLQQTRRQAPQGKTGERQMPTISLLLAFVFVLAGSTMAGAPDGSLPGIGTFSYNGSPIPMSAPIVVATR